MDPKDDHICFRCKHGTQFGCTAFPDGIPDKIWISNKHSKPIEDQVGDYVFEPKEEGKED